MKALRQESGEHFFYGATTLLAAVHLLMSLMSLSLSSVLMSRTPQRAMSTAASESPQLQPKLYNVSANGATRRSAPSICNVNKGQASNSTHLQPPVMSQVHLLDSDRHQQHFLFLHL